mmetsp:Transcript_4351/g.9659  ORF Transcript_4351/g.9659 Transcript_4351/m.9659 type:complete len:119 (+) Transcript_4351:565-921(+)
MPQPPFFADPKEIKHLREVLRQRLTECDNKKDDSKRVWCRCFEAYSAWVLSLHRLLLRYAWVAALCAAAFGAGVVGAAVVVCDSNEKDVARLLLAPCALCTYWFRSADAWPVWVPSMF